MLKKFVLVSFVIMVAVTFSIWQATCVCAKDEKHAAAQQTKPADKAAEKPATQDKSAAAPNEKGAEYAACSPGYPGEQIAEMMEFAGELSPQLPDKLKPVLMKCDFNINNQILAFLEQIQEEMAGANFETEDQEKLFLSEKAKEVEAELILVQQPVNQDELKKVVSDIFDLRQQSLKNYLAAVEKEVDQIKKRLDERVKLKDKIVEKKMKEFTAAQQETAQSKSLTQDDPLIWD